MRFGAPKPESPQSFHRRMEAAGLEDAADRWKRCPSTHCERRHEGASPGDCIVVGDKVEQVRCPQCNDTGFIELPQDGGFKRCSCSHMTDKELGLRRARAM